jgi:prophage antirepressor-like protein
MVFKKKITNLKKKKKKKTSFFGFVYNQSGLLFFNEFGLHQLIIKHCVNESTAVHVQYRLYTLASKGNITKGNK